MDPETSTHQHRGGLHDMTEFLTKFTFASNTVNESSGDSEKRNIRNSALKIFHRYRRHKSVSSGTLQISDTSNSIRKDPSVRSNSASSVSLDRNNRTSFRPFERRTPRSFTSELGTVTVLKPVSEFTEPYQASYNPLRDSTQSRSSLGRELLKKTETFPCIEASSSHELENKCNSPLKSLQEIDITTATNQFSNTEKSSLAQSEKWPRQDSPTTESLRSGCSSSRKSNSAYSRAYHSEVSTSRGTSPDLYPPRLSSKYYHPYSNERLVDIERNPEPSHDILTTTPPRRQTESLSTSPLIFTTGTAKLARSFSSAGIEKPCIVRCSSPSLNLASSSPRKSSSVHTSRPTTPLSTQLRNESSQSSLEYKGTIHEASWIAPVRMGRTSTGGIRESNGYRCLSRSLGLRSSCNSPIPTLSIRQSVSSVSTSSVSSQPISISQVMTVANVAPDFEQFNDPALVMINKRNSKKLSSVPAIAIATPLNYASSDSEDLETAPQYSFRKQRSTNSLRSIDPFSCHPRSIRRSENIQNGALSARELDLNTRLSKMERDNAMLISALDDIVKKFSASGIYDAPSSRYEEEDEKEKLNRKELRRVLKKNSTRGEEVREESLPGVSLMEEEKRNLFNRVRF
ncbi:hypothetical protein OnM2_055035 [Erysiphe neolycopersici]|uniref:Uncharacterized protein n=1 Tax=Erysiphe neolycopersici TaxID=212602 RepID=A0A420HRC4_9PEZI|nr:hypothetical protein OnM2_055035 [Erysiphe neolycopersici]